MHALSWIVISCWSNLRQGLFDPRRCSLLRTPARAWNVGLSLAENGGRDVGSIFESLSIEVTLMSVDKKAVEGPSQHKGLSGPQPA